MAINVYLGGPPENIKKWIKENYYSAPLCFTAEEAGSTIQMMVEGSAPTVYLETSTSGEDGSWSDFTVGSTTITLANVGDKVYFRAKQDNERFGTSTSDYNKFVMAKGKIAASGNLNTLLKADGSVLDLTGKDYCYFSMFYGCSSLTKAPELPATELAKGCYSNMFYGCSSLTKAPKLPATTLADACYQNTFRDCTSLTQAPELLATKLANYCYTGMFNNCISLVKAPKLSATTLAYYCYDGMFYNSDIPLFTVDMTACTSVPPLPIVSLFSSSGKPYTVLVPASLYDSWIKATNWSTITSNIRAV